MGAPKKKETADCFLHMRITRKEKDKLIKAAKKNGMTMSQFIKNWINGEP